MRKLCTYLIIILLANISFLFSPREFPPDAIHKWGDFYIALNPAMGVRVNGDAFAFVALAIKPSLLLEENQVRQSRPGYILAGNLVGSVIYTATYPFRDQLEQFFQARIKDKFPQKDKEKIARWFSYYSAYILLNFVVLLASLFLLDKLVITFSGPWKNTAIRYIFLFLLVDNPVTKLFFWSPHVQLFNILTPLLLVWTSLYITRHAGSASRLYATCGIAGILVLFYGSFLLLFPAILYGYFKHQQSNPGEWSLKRLFQLGAMAAIFVFPLLCWIAFVHFNGVHFYSAEVSEYRQFIWIIDAFQQSTGSLITALFSNSVLFIQSLGSLLAPAIFLLAALLYSRNRDGNLFLENEAKHLLAFTFLLCLLFFWLLGYYADRLSLSLAALCFLLAALYLNRKPSGKGFSFFLGAMAITWHFLLVTGNPTNFSPSYFN